MSRPIGEIELLAELGLLEQDALNLASTWKSTAVAAADGDAARVHDVLILDTCTHELIRTVKALIVRMVKAGFEAEDAGFGRCLALLCAVGEMSVHFAETVQAAKRVVEIQREVAAARELH